MRRLLFFYSVLLLCLVTKYSAKYCDSTERTKRAFNVGHNVFINDQWIFDPTNRAIIGQQFETSEMFGNTFESINTGLSFEFPECTSKTTQFCQTVSKARNLLIVIGVIDGSSGYACYHYSKQYPKELILVTDSDMPWGLPSTGELKGDFWISSKDKDGNIYESIVFVPQRNELYASLRQNKNYLYTRKLDRSGVFSDKWKMVLGSTLRGMFYIDSRVFGIDVYDMVFELKWSVFTPTYHRRANAKEFFNCYSNSTLGPPKVTDVTNEMTKDALYTNRSENGVRITVAKPIETKPIAATEASVEERPKPKKKQSNTVLYIAISVVTILFLLLIISIIFVVMVWSKKSSKHSKPKRLIVKKDRHR